MCYARAHKESPLDFSKGLLFSERLFSFQAASFLLRFSAVIEPRDVRL